MGIGQCGGGSSTQDTHTHLTGILLKFLTYFRPQDFIFHGIIRKRGRWMGNWHSTETLSLFFQDDRQGTIVPSERPGLHYENEVSQPHEGEAQMFRLWFAPSAPAAPRGPRGRRHMICKNMFEQTTPQPPARFLRWLLCILSLLMPCTTMTLVLCTRKTRLSRMLWWCSARGLSWWKVPAAWHSRRGCKKTGWSIFARRGRTQ